MTTVDDNQSRLCTVEGCERSHLARGYCKLHYERLRAHGDIEVRPPRWGRTGESDPRNMSGEERADFGAIVSFQNDRGQRLTLHREGGVIASVHAMCAMAIARDDSYRVLAISTPASIMGDLDGRIAGAHSATGTQIAVLNQDASILRRAGFAELLHPRYGGRGHRDSI